MAAGFYDILRFVLGWKSVNTATRIGGTWILDARSTTWVLETRNTNWVLDTRGTNWTLPDR